MVESCPKDSPGQKSLLEAAKAFGEAFDLPRLGSRQACDLRAAIAREEERPPATTDGERRCWEGLVDSWRKGHDEQRDRAQQAEANEQWLRNECNRIDRLVADERQRAEKAEAEVSSAAVKFLAMHQRAEKAEAERDLAKNQMTLAVERSERQGALIQSATQASGCHLPADVPDSIRSFRARADKAGSELAAVHEALKACLRPETQTGSAIGDAKRIGKSLQHACAHLFRALPGVNVVERDLPLVVDELLWLRAEAESVKGRMASAIAADLDTARDHLQAVVGAAKVACTAMSRAWGLVGTSEQPALDAAQTTLSAAAANARHMVLDRVDPKSPAAGGLVDATPAAWFQAEIDRLRKANHDLQEQNWDLQVPDFPPLSLDHLHYAYMPGDWSSQADEWFVYDRLMRNGHRTRLVRVRWRHGPGVSNSAPKSASPPFEGDPKACAFKPSEPKVSIVRDPVTGWTFDTMRQQFDAARTTVRVLAAELVAARQQIAGTKGFEA